MAAGNRHSEPSSDASRDQTGIAKAKTAGTYKGRPATIDAAQVRALKAQGQGASEIAKALKIGRASVYRVLEAG
jgi:DNA invertase Pin-like site-specific DNA recombinase